MSESGFFFFRFFEGGKTYNSEAPAAGFRHLCTSMTVFVNFSTWAIFFEGGSFNIFWEGIPPPLQEGKNTGV